MDSSNNENDRINEKKLECTQSLDGIKKFFPFLYKLHMITNKLNHPFIVWSNCGMQIQFEYMGMQDYLMSESSIFYEKSMFQFVERLSRFEFTKFTKGKSVEAETLPPKVWLYYEHPNFQRDHREFIEKIEGANELYDYVPLTSLTKKDFYDDCIGEPSNLHHIRQRERGDLCSTITGSMSRVERTRIRLHLQLRFQREQSVLLQKVTEADTVSVKKVEQKGSRIVTRVTNEPVVKLPDNKFESPLETNLAVQNPIDPELGGFYGITDLVKIEDFFGEFLPRRENDTIVIKVPEKELPPNHGKKKDQKSSIGQAIKVEELVGSDADDIDDDDDYVVNSSPGNDFNNVSLAGTLNRNAFDSPNEVNDSVDDAIQNALNTLCGDPEENKLDEKDFLIDPFRNEFGIKKIKRTEDEDEQAVNEEHHSDEQIESNSFGDYYDQIDANTEIKNMDIDFGFEMNKL